MRARRSRRPAGPTTFEVTNDGAAAVTEFEVLETAMILGEVENVIPGLDRPFSLTLKAGNYTTYCPGGSTGDEGTLEVADAASGSAATQRRTAQAAVDVPDYVKGEADAVDRGRATFAAAVRRATSPGRRQLFAGARSHYEAIEPIAESFGDLDPPSTRAKATWPTPNGAGSTASRSRCGSRPTEGMGPVADRSSPTSLGCSTQIDDVELEPAHIANGAVELLNEVSTSKITGEEDRYCHTDLSDFAANVAGPEGRVRRASRRCSTQERRAATEFEQRFDDVQAASTPQGAGPLRDLHDNALTPDDTRALSSVLDALAEPLSKVAAPCVSRAAIQ